MSSFRQLMMKAKGDIPSSYKVLDYIETTIQGYEQGEPYTGQGAYIDTGFMPTSATKIVTKIKVSTTYQNNPVFGLYSPNTVFHLTPFSYKWYTGLTTSTETSGGSYNNTVGTVYDITFNDNGSIIVNNTTILSGLTYTIPSANLCIARRGSVSGRWSSMFGWFKYYLFQIYDNGVLVRDFVPVRRKSDSVLGMYDKVNGVFYTNAGTGNFVGSDE